MYGVSPIDEMRADMTADAGLGRAVRRRSTGGRESKTAWLYLPCLLALLLVSGGCAKVKRLVTEKVAAAIEDKIDEAVAENPEVPAKKLDPAAEVVAAVGAVKVDDGGDYDAALLAQIDALAACARVRKTDCPVYAELEKTCKAAWKVSADDVAGYSKRWRTLLQGVATAAHYKSRYGAVYLANFACAPTKALRSDEAQGRKLLAALKREGKEGWAASRMAALLASWWRADLPKLHEAMQAFMVDKTHPVTAGRKELARLAGFYAVKNEPLGRALIALALDGEEEMAVRRNAASHLWRVAKSSVLAEPALAAMAQLAAAKPGPLTMSAYAGLGYAGATKQWPALVANWRTQKADKLVGAAMAKATWRYAVAKYPTAEVGVPQRLAAMVVATEVLGDEALASNSRSWAIYTLQYGGHPGAKKVLTRIAKGGDATLAKAAQSALKNMKPVDPLLLKGAAKGAGQHEEVQAVKAPAVKARAVKPKRAKRRSHGHAQPTRPRRTGSPHRPTRPGR